MMSGALAIGTKSGNLLIMDIKGYGLTNGRHLPISRVSFFLLIYLRKLSLICIDEFAEVFNCARKTNLCDISQNRVSCMLIMDLKQYSENDIKDKICKVDDDNYHVAVSIPGNTFFYIYIENVSC